MSAKSTGSPRKVSGTAASSKDAPVGHKPVDPVPEPPDEGESASGTPTPGPHRPTKEEKEALDTLKKYGNIYPVYLPENATVVRQGQLKREIDALVLAAQSEADSLTDATPAPKG